jgi:glycosyltransferase involved in cell wall biosynthesis
LILDKKVAVVMPAHNASTTLEQTWSEIPHEIIDEIILVDDYSSDDTVQKARNLGIQYVIEHDRNKGSGGNQKSCYRKSLELGVGIIVMLHPDYQYPPKLIYPMCYLIAQGLYPVVLGSRILGGSALSDGMPVYKYISNRVLTFVENMFLGLKLSEYHT